MTLQERDYLSEKDAALYACVSLSQFRKEAPRYGIFPGWFMGKKVYRRGDIQRALEASWRH